MKKVIREVHDIYLATGFEYQGRNGSGHHSYLWPETGETIELPSTPSGSFVPQAALRRARKIAPIPDARTKRRPKP